MSSRNKIQNVDPFIPVKAVPLYTVDGSLSSRKAIMLDPDGEYTEVGIVSDNYQLVSNESVHDIALDVLSMADMPYEDSGYLFDGKRYRHRWVLPDLEMEPTPGDFVHVALDLTNSYDGSTTFGLAFNARRLVCSNGMMVDFKLGGFKFRHWGKDDFSEELQDAAERIRRLAPQLDPLSNDLRRLTETPVSRRDIQKSFSDLKLPKTTQSDIFMAIEEDTQWGLYNGYTDVLTRQESHNADNLNRKVTKYLLAA